MQCCLSKMDKLEFEPNVCILAGFILDANLIRFLQSFILYKTIGGIVLNDAFVLKQHVTSGEIWPHKKY